MTTYTAEQIIRIGGREWKKGDKHRVYLNQDVWTELIGLETSHYNTGNISGATLDGERISNARAKDIIGCISSVYFDVDDGKIYILTWGNRYAKEVPGWIRDAIAEKVTATEPKPTDDSDDTDGGTPNAAGMVDNLRQAGRTVREIANMVGVSISTIYRWAHGICRPRPINAAALAALA